MSGLAALVAIMTIAQTIRGLLQDQWWKPKTPQNINNGECSDFADQVEEQGFGRATWGDELNHENWSPIARCIPDWSTHAAPFHCFVEHQGRYYDAECPDGMDWPDELPFYQREIKFHRKKGLRLEKVTV